jgi:hypothetical protein
MKKLLTNCKSFALVVVFIGLAAMSSANASPLPDDENLVCTNAILQGKYHWSVAGLIWNANLNNGNIGDFAPLVEASYAVFDGHGTITKLVSTDNLSTGGSFTVTGTGTYSVNPDCSGSLTFNTTVGSINRHLEILDGNTVDFVHTDAGLIIAGTMRKRKETRKTQD